MSGHEHPGRQVNPRGFWSVLVDGCVWLGRIVTPIGWASAFTVAAGFGAGYLLGWVEAVVFGWAILAVVVVAVLFVVGRTAFDITVALPLERVVAGQSAHGTVGVTNRARRRVPAGRLELQIGDRSAEFALGSLRRGARFENGFAVPTTRRGVIPVGPARTIRSDPFGLFRRELVWGTPIPLYVHPVTVAIPSMSTGFVRDLEGAPTRDLTVSDISFHALREYAPGDEPRTIHWKSTARTGSYMVRQFEETRRSHLLVALSVAPDDYALDDEFELAVSVAGSLGVRAIRDGRSLSVVVGERTPDGAKRPVHAVRALDTISPSRLLDGLALLERDTPAIRIGELARLAAASATGISVAFLICGSSPTAGQLRAASARYPAGVEVIAVVCDPGAVPGLRRAGGLSVLRVGYLSDLQKSLATSRAA